MDRIDDIGLFLRVLDLGSISAAARSLDLSVAVASQRLRRLEQGLGVLLFQRTTRRLHPTAEGLQLAEQGRVLVQEFEALTAGLRQRGGEPAGRLRVTMSATFGRMYISPLLPAFMGRHPLLQVTAHLSDQTVDLVGEGFDLAIRIGQLRDSSLVARRIAVDQRVLCASAGYLARAGNPQVPADLAQHDCLMLFDASGRRDVWQFHHPHHGAVEVRVSGRLESTVGELLRDAALAGEGIGLFSHWHVADDLRKGRLQALLPEWQLPEAGIHAVTPHRRLVPPRVRAFVEFLDEQFGTDPPWQREPDAQPARQ